MPYLGPKSFDTTPLTSNNLAYLNNCLLSSNANDNNQINNQVNNQVSDNSIDSYNKINHNNKDNNVSGNNSGNSTTSDNNNISHNIDDNISNNINNNVSNNISNNINNNVNNNVNNNNSLSTVSSTNSLSGLLTNSTLTSLGNSSQNDNDSYTHTYSRTIIDDDDNKTEIIPSTPRTVILHLDTNSISSKKPASVSSLSSSSSSHSPADLLLQLPSKLIRKKSGELVKSSLKLNSLKRSNSMPNTKNVRFASRLENVKFFHKCEKPTAVSTENFALVSSTLKPVWEFNYSDEEEEEEEDDGSYSNPVASSSSSEAQADKNNQKWEIIKNDCPYNPVSLNFTRLNNTSKNIILESIKLNSSKTALIGFIYVKNLTFEKKIIVKFTIDDWKSFIEIENANYISSNHIFKYSDSESSNYDKFSFIIKLNTLSSFKQILNIKFCILYVANENSYWDNNYNKNYDILLKKIDKRNKVKHSNKNSDKTKYKFNEKEDLKIKSPVLSDMDDIHLKLKNNNNFDDLLNKSNESSPLHNNNIQLRNSKKFLIKKVKSESSLPTMSSSFFNSSPIKSQPISQSKSFSNYPVSSNNNTTTSPSKTPLIKKQYSKSAAPSPSLTASGFNLNPKDFQDYDKIVQQFCFFGSDIPNTNNNSSIYKSSFDRNTQELTTDLSSFCLN